jgi:beta-glucosidase
MKNKFCTAILLALTISKCLGAPSSMDSFVSTLMGKMSLDDEIGQLNLLSTGFDVTGPVANKNVEASVRAGRCGGVFNLYTPKQTHRLQQLAVEKSPLRIPLLFGYDVIHGHKTIFPIPLALSCTWDMGLIEKTARIAASEASADGVNWTFSPMVDIARDPRWGRISEGAGEDPYLGSLIAQAMVRGYQGPGNDLTQTNHIMACVKHFALYGAVSAGRDYNPADMSHLTMYQYYFPPYKAAVDAGAASVMAAFNEVDGIPATASHWLLTDVLRKQWGFQGLVVSDYTAIQEMTAHGMGDYEHDAELAIKAGMDMDMVSELYVAYLKKLVEQKTISKNLIDTACRHVLEAKYKLGLFTDPYRGCTEDRAINEILTPDNLAFARDAAEHSFVLLKNARETLPLKHSGVVAVIGPLATSRRDLLGSWSAAGDWKMDTSILDSIKEIAGTNATILHQRGANLLDDSELISALNSSGADIVPDKRAPKQMIDDAVATAKKADVVIAVLGESFAMSGEAASRSDIGLPKGQEELLHALVATGKPVVLVLLNGRPLDLSWEALNCAAILETWFGGIDAGHATAHTLFGDYNPSGRLTTTFPRNVGQVPLFYDHKNTGRPFLGDPRVRYESRYLDVPNSPLYPFGYGLTYTQFAYGKIRVNKTSLYGNDSLVATINVANVGKRWGEETVQLYITDPAASVTRSVEDLRGFQKIILQPGQQRDVSFTITPDDLKFYNSDLVYDWEPGDFFIRIGRNSSELDSTRVHWEKTRE